MMRGETVQTGAPLDCGDEGCAIRGPAIYESAAGYYVGYWCMQYLRQPTNKVARQAVCDLIGA